MRNYSKKSILIGFHSQILGVHLDPTLSMDNQVKASIKACNYHIRALRHVLRGLTLESAKLIALGLVTSRLDYCNSLLYGTSKSNLNKLQRVQSDLARVVLQAAWNSSSEPLLKQLHWLSVQQRIIFKMALITFNVRSSEQPSYLHSLLDNYTPSRNVGLRDNIFFGFLSGGLRQLDVASVSARQQFGTVSIRKLAKPTHSSHSRRV